jgi:hypothetical protein
LNHPSVHQVLGFAAIARGGFALNHLDVAPAYAGSVMSVANTAGTFAGIVGVGLTGQLCVPIVLIMFERNNGLFYIFYVTRTYSLFTSFRRSKTGPSYLCIVAQSPL